MCIAQKKCLQIFAHRVLHCSFPVECVCTLNTGGPLQKAVESLRTKGSVVGRTLIPQSSRGARTVSGMACVVSVLASREGCAGVRKLPLQQGSVVAGLYLLYIRQGEIGTWTRFTCSLR
ncbi:similar to RIKEN cDNA 2600010E01 [Rattus norvegicus]|uniref:Similar to RIKEN cDNA 2600010E01 n=1 Tax=Rattus norvegicus TaxID=10116 RepID=A6HNM5_RAT|nr:similar to RIKEN cDNA 2600010E01 [Rattus norvegicus]